MKEMFIMKKAIKVYAVLLAALAVTAALSGCAGSKDNKNSSSQVSEAASQQSSEESAVSDTESSKVSEESGTGSSAPESSEPEEKSREISAEVSDEDSEGESSENSNDGYFFDDEQIVKDYHNAVVFTDDEEFNKLFNENSIDKEYNKEIKDTENVIQMREVTIKYGELWAAEAEEAYQKLNDALESMPEEQEKLAASQNEWHGTLEETEAGFQKEASENGTYGLLAADSAMMNYYKGRAAVLYHQIYVLSGTFDME